MISEQDLRLDALAGEIRQWNQALINAERDATEMSTSEYECWRLQARVIECRVAREAAMLAYVNESELARRGLQRVA